MKENSIKNERSSIEEDIKELKEMIDSDIESVGGVEGFNNYYEHDFGTSIEFKNKYKEINVSGHIGIEELQAINKKAEELRWMK